MTKGISCSDTVLVRSKKVDIKDKKGPLSKEEIERRAKILNEDIIEGLVLMKSIISKKEVRGDPKFKVAGIPDVVRKYRGSMHERLEWEDERFYSTVYVASKSNRMLALNEKKNMLELVDISLLDKINAMKDVIYTLGVMHKYGIIQKDLKPSNILLKFTNRMEGFLIDFDITCLIGFYPSKKEYQYWDRCSEIGLVLPTVDLFGAIATLADFVFETKFSLKMAKARKSHLFFEMEMIIEEYKRKYISNLNNVYLREVGKNSKQKKIKYEAEKKAIEEISALIHDIYLADKELHKYIKTSEGGLFFLDIVDDERPSIVKYEIVVQEIYERFPVFRDLDKRLSTIQRDLEKVKDQLPD